MAQALTQARALLQSNPDSAILLTNQILTKLARRKEVDTSFGLQVQLVRASAFNQTHRNDQALKQLLHLEQRSRETNQWAIHARACLELALAYEITEFTDRSRHQLDVAKADIDRYGLAAVYPKFAVRMASWHRLYNDKDSALFYAGEALRTAPTYGSLIDEADGHLLMTMLLGQSSYKKGIEHSINALRLYRKMGNEEIPVWIQYNVAYLYFDGKNFSRALTYCDSSIGTARQQVAAGRPATALELLASAYRLRGRIYQKMGRLDSALASTKRWGELALQAKDKEVRDKIEEIDARYQTKLHRQQIDEQQLALQFKNNQLLFTTIIALLLVGLAVILLVGYRKQRQGKQKLLEQNTLIQQQATQLQHLDAAKSRFFANVSHELRTPLTLLLGPIATLLNDNQLTNKQTSLLQLANRNGRQLQQLITDILDLGKLELGRMKLDLKPTPLATFFRSHFAQFTSLAESRNLHYSFAITAPDDTVVNLDQAKCRQILNNLLSNAFKFTPADGYVTATLTLVNDQLQLSVTDSGLGIHPDDLPHLFDRYFQTTRPDKPAEGGTGIGLALCHEYVQLLGGSIDVASSPSNGSVFRVNFPVSVLPTNAITQPDQTSLLPQTAPVLPADSLRAIATGKTGGATLTVRPTILVVEDNSDLQAYIRLILADTYQVLTADNGQDALKKLRTTADISLILSDLMMPIMDGYQLLEALKADDATRHIPVIMLTARADMRDRLRALRIGVDDYLLKPFDEAELLARINNLLANQTARLQTVVPEQPAADSLRQSEAPLLSQADQEWLENFEQYVQHHLADAELTVPELAYHFAMSESTLLRQLKRLTGLSPQQYIQAVRLEEARRLLESRTGDSIAQVAAKVGYDDARSFSRNFRTRFGKLPSDLLET